AESGVGGVRYTVLVDGRVAGPSTRRLRLRIPPVRAGNGISKVQVLATDTLGQQALSAVAKVRVDGQGPLGRGRSRARSVTVALSDGGAGLKTKSSLVSFGDGSRLRGGAHFRHAYDSPGTYAVRVFARDRAGNKVLRRFEVRVR